MVSGIYCYENIINGKRYIGKAKNINKRKSYHERNFRREECLKGENILLWRSVKKYGRDSFKFYIIEYCNLEFLNEKEIFYINKFKAHISMGGYNFLLGGGKGTEGYIFSDETKDKIRKANTGKHVSEETKEKLRIINLGIHDGKKNRFYGKKHTDETKQKMRDNHHKLKGETHPNYGKKLTSEEKDRLRKANIGKKNPNSISKFYGVTFSIVQNKYSYWRSWFQLPKRTISLGVFKKEIDAAKNRDKYVIKNGFDNPLNFPKLLYIIDFDILFTIYNFLNNNIFRFLKRT